MTTVKAIKSSPNFYLINAKTKFTSEYFIKNEIN